MMRALLAAGWALLVAQPVLWCARRAAVHRRGRSLRPHRSGRGRRRRWVAVPVSRGVLASALGARRSRRATEAARTELPATVDLVALAVGAGCTPRVAMEVAAVHCGRRLPPALDASVRALHLGATLDEALADSVRREPVLAPLADVLATSARLGVPATPSLARLGSEVRADVRRRAEARARAVPVTLLFPLVLCVLPAFALLTVVPALIDGLGA